MKKILGFLLIIAISASVFMVRTWYEENKEDDFFYRDTFDSLNKDFWYVGEWKTMFEADDKAILEDSKIKLVVNETDRGPFLLSKPLEIEKGDIISVKRKIKVMYNNNNFSGGFALLGTDEEEIRPKILEDKWSRGLGNGIVLIEYVHNYLEESVRPGRDIFRVLPPTWDKYNNYEIIEPIFDEWFEEELIYNTEIGSIRYIINGTEYSVKGLPFTKKYIRIFTHSYGYYTGHSMEIDWVEIEIKRK
ncbi:MAG: hypothetical protein N4A76_11095 [Firmicutes bacterium]|nr:hypothetical protein [Bacillota bacterium]